MTGPAVGVHVGCQACSVSRPITAMHAGVSVCRPGAGTVSTSRIRMRNTQVCTFSVDNFAVRFLDRKPERVSSDQQQSTAFDGAVRTYDDDEEVVCEYSPLHRSRKLSRVSCARFIRT